MKKLWVNLLAVLLFAALAMTCASAEADEEIILGDGLEVEVQLEAADDGFVLEDDLSMDAPELPVLGENDSIALDLSLEDVEAVTVSPDDAVESNDDVEDFEIINGILVKYNGPGGNVVIPNIVTTIGQSAFRFCSNLKSVTIPNKVIKIDNYAFQGCSSLTDITIPDGLANIGASAFEGCENLITIKIPNSVTTIGYWAFYGCSSLTTITIPNNMTDIEWATFAHCSSLINISIPNSVLTIGDSAFSDCTSLTEITIPQSVNLINGSAFQGCTYLTDVTIESNETIWISDNAFEGCYSLTTFHTHCETTATKWAKENGYTVDKSDHTPITDPAVAPTCAKPGLTEGTHCSVCNAVIKAQEEVPALAHTPVKDPAVAPTCTKTGLTEGSHCSVCNAIIKAQEVVPVAEHTPVTDPAVEPTCTKTGLTEGSHCSVCGKTLVKQRTVPKAEHTYVIDEAVAPTCTRAGKTAGTHCSVCGKVFVKQKKIPKLISLKKCNITGIKDAVYTGKAIKPSPVVKYNGKKLVKGTDYTVKYANNKAVGKATVTITGIGKYGESVSKAFKINPKAVALAGLTAGKQQLTVKWKKGTGITGYEVQYGLKRSFAGAKTIAIKKAATVKTVLKKLTTGKKYYVRVRAYKTVSGKKYYSAWSKAKSAKVK